MGAGVVLTWAIRGQEMKQFLFLFPCVLLKCRCPVSLAVQHWELNLVLCDTQGVGGAPRGGTYVYLWLIHTVVWQKPAQYCKAIYSQLKVNFKKRW